MDQKPDLSPMSLVVEMEQHDYARGYVLPEPMPTTMMERKNVPPSINQIQHSDNVIGSNYRKLDAAVRRQLRAQLRSSIIQVDTPLLHTFEKLTGSRESLTNGQISPNSGLEAAENGESLHAHLQERVEVFGEGVRPEDTPTSTDSEVQITRNGDKVSMVTNTSCGTNCTIMENEQSSVITKAWYAFEKSWKLQVTLTQEERRNGYRFFKKIDPAYLGFYPNQRDKRKFLKAYPIIGHIPEDNLGCDCSLPVTFSQWSFVVGFFVVFGALGTGAYLYLRIHRLTS